MTSFGTDWFRDPDAVVTALSGDGGGVVPDIPGYEVLVEVSRGSQAVVLLARRKETGERVAIKVLVSAAWISERARRRFDREIEMVSSLNHPNIVRVLDSGSSIDGHPFLVMEYVEGVPLDEYLAPPHDHDGHHAFMAGPFLAICDAVSYAHRRGIMHRDLKPSNIRVDAAGRPRVLDFGLARLAPPLNRTGCSQQSEIDRGDCVARLSLTVTTQFLGTPAYAAPEQFLRQPHEIDTRADVYALGVILYQAVTGRLPYRDSNTIGGLIRNITGNEIIMPGLSLPGAPARRAGVPPDLEAVILKALAGDPQERYQTVNALADDIRAVLDGRPTTARTPTRREALFRAIRQNRAVAALIIAVVVVSLGFAATASMMALRLDQARRDAVIAEENARADAARSQAVLDFLTGLIFDAHTADDETQIAMSRLILDRAHERMAASPPDVPAVRAELHNIVGRTYYSIDAPERAIEHLGAAVAGDGFGDQPSRRLHIQALLSLALFDEGHTAASEEVVRQFLDERGRPAVESARADRSSIDVYAAATLFRLAERLRDAAGNLALAREVLREALDSSPLDTEPHRIHAYILKDLAEVGIAQGERVEMVMPLLERAVAIATRTSGPDSHYTLDIRSSVARALERQGRLSEALSEMTDITNRRIASLGESSPRTLAAMVDLARLQLNTGDRASAHRTLSAVLPLCISALGPDDAMTIEVQRLLTEASEGR